MTLRRRNKRATAERVFFSFFWPTVSAADGLTIKDTAGSSSFFVSFWLVGRLAGSRRGGPQANGVQYEWPAELVALVQSGQMRVPKKDGGLSAAPPSAVG
jgi:hypothetical protein